MDFFNADNHAHLISVTLDFQMICKELKREREKERERESSRHCSSHSIAMGLTSIMDYVLVHHMINYMLGSKVRHLNRRKAGMQTNVKNQ